jgi:hypothetical protein
MQFMVCEKIIEIGGQNFVAGKRGQVNIPLSILYPLPSYPFLFFISVRLSKTKLKSNVEELQSLNTIQNDENITLQRDKLLLTDEICDLQSKVTKHCWHGCKS